ncbi:MAG TPA: alpha/beta hydrolase [Longimicrobiaceae bacterium]|nr:alpha/beta hydrolase [Longimicrobiaceae bacterium]
MTTGDAGPATGLEPRTRFVGCGGVRLHALDWGGDGPPLVFLPGLGQSAHVFREIAPEFAGEYRVVALTARSHGESDAPEHGYTVDAFAADLRGAMDELGIGRAVLAAHSAAGAWATRFAADHPDRVRAMIYLDAVTDYAGYLDVQVRNPYPAPPRPRSGDTAAEREWMRRHVPGFWCGALEADLATRPPAAELMERSMAMASLFGEVAAHPQPYAGLRCPALALVATDTVETQYPWLDAADAEKRGKAEAYIRTVRAPWRAAAVERFRREAPGGRVLEMPGGHFFFLSQRERTAAEIRAFLSPLDHAAT